MGQTLLAVLALALLSFLMLNSLQTRNAGLSDQAERIVAEEARGVSAGLLEQLAMLPFDGADPYRTPSDAFGPPTGIDPALTVSQVIAAHLGDLDDAHSLTRDAHVVRDDLPSGLSNPLVFETSIAVSYVRPTDDGWMATSDTTDQKRVALQVRFPRTNTHVELSRVYSDLQL